jgi:hypothetical protein
MTFMKGKLVKCNHFYALQIDSDIIAVSLDKETEEHTVNYKHQLSLKNCEAIENGYDLDELADYHFGIVGSEGISSTHSFKVGFQKSLEILGDKKFSEKDIRNGMEKVWYWHEDNQDKDCPTLYELIPKHMQSLKQTEWEVEVVMDRIPADLAPGGWDVFPKLDAENCLILKKVE